MRLAVLLALLLTLPQRAARPGTSTEEQRFNQIFAAYDQHELSHDCCAAMPDLQVARLSVATKRETSLRSK